MDVCGQIFRRVPALAFPMRRLKLDPVPNELIRKILEARNRRRRSRLMPGAGSPAR